MSNGDMSQYVTRDELAGRLEPLSEIRSMLRDDIRVLHTGQTSLSDQIAEMSTQITTRQDVANGRLGKTEALVTAIKTGGCDQRKGHMEVLSAMAAAGIVPSTGEVLDPPVRPTWTRRHKAVSAGLGLGGLGLGALLPHVGPALHWIATLLERGVK